MMELKFRKKKQNTKGIQFRLDPITSKNLNSMRAYYSKKADRRVTNGEIIKQLINNHYEEII
jgi:hypothetical protein